MSEMIPFDNLDQSLPVDATTELKIVDEIFETSIKENDPEIMFTYLVGIQQQFQIKGLALCKSLHLMNKYWEAFEIGDNFLDTAVQYLGIHRHTIERYVKVWDMFSVAPKLLVPELQQKGISSLIPIANAVAQGYEIDDSVWDRLADAPDRNSVSKIINEQVKDMEGTRSNRLTILLDRKGSLWAIMDEERVFIGSLEIDDDNAIVQKAIERLTKNSGVVRQ